MNGFRIKIGDEWISDSSVQAITANQIANEFDRKAIVFCQSWLTNKESFEFHTSGSTGNPKKITFRREQLIASAKMTAKALQLKSGDTSLVCLDTDFIAGAMMLVRGLVVGMNMIIKSPSANPLENISDPIAFTALVPYQVIRLLERGSEKFNSISKAIIGGAPLSLEAIESLQNLSTQFYATYGMTETITHVALQKLNGSDRQDYFQLLPGVEVYVDDRECLVIRAAHLGDEAIITNDIVSLIGKDKFRWIGRYDRVINSGGIKISPEKIESAVEHVFFDLKISNRFFVDHIPNPNLGQQVVLVVEGQIIDTTVEKISDTLRKTLNKYEMPKKIIPVSGFVETATMKIDRIATMKLTSQDHFAAKARRL